MNWKKKAIELLNEHLLESYKRDVIHNTNTSMEEAVVKAMFDFAKLACIEQKEVCGNESFHTNTEINNSIKRIVYNAPTVKFD